MDAQTGRGAKLLTIDRARRLTHCAEAREMFVQSIEAFNLLADDRIQINLDFSILGLGHDEHAATTPQAMNDVARSIFDLVERLGEKVAFNIWVAPNGDFTPTKR